MADTNDPQKQHNLRQLAYYEARAPGNNKRVFVRSTPYILNHLEKFVDFADLQKDQPILDIGCGMGKYTIPLGEAGYRVDGLDLSGKLLGELADQAAGRAKIATYCADVLDPPAELIGKYQHVIGFFALHHLFDLQQAFTSIARMLKPGGSIAFLEPNPLCVLFYLQIALSPSMSWSAEKGIRNFTTRHTTACLKTAGFADIRFSTFGTLPPALRNTSVGAAFEAGYDQIAPLRPISAFKLVRAQRPDASSGP